MAAHLNTLLIQHFLVSIVRNSILSWINKKYTRIKNNNVLYFCLRRIKLDI